MIKILIITPFYRPAYKAGGPIKTIYNFIDQLGEYFNLNILTSDRDLGDKKPFSNVAINKWINIEKANIFYASEKFRSFGKVKKAISLGNYDYIYINSFFSFDFSIKIVLLHKLGFIKNKIILAPRGEFSPGALDIKGGKKNIFIFFSKIFGLYKNIIWHTTSEMESTHIRSIWGNNVKIRFAPNLGSKIMLKNNKPVKKQKGSLKIVFLSRISVKKNLIYLLEILSSNLLNGEIELDIFGSLEDKTYYNKCMSVIKIIPKNIAVSYKGLIKPEEVISTLSKYHLFFFPTKGENFGHVILEALSAGCPLLISDQTPWRDLQSKGVGWDINLENKKDFARIIEEAINWSQDEFNSYSKKSIIFAKKSLNNFNALDKYKTLFN